MDEPRQEGAPPFEPEKTAVFKTLPRPDLQILPGDGRPIEVEIVGGSMDGQRRRIEGEALSIGRGEDNDLSLAHDSSVSLHHARIVREEGHYWLEDQESRNGTFLGDERIQARTLIGPGTLFYVGSTCIEFMPL